MEAQGDPFRRGLPTLQTSLTHPELPPYPRHFRSEDLFRFLKMAGIWGKFLFGTGGANVLYGAASHPIGRREAFGNYALRECRDSACRHTRKVSCLTTPTHKKSATAALCKKSPPPQTQKNFPHNPATTKSESNLRSVNGGVMGEVLGERGRFGGREPHLSRGGSLPPRSSSPPPLRICKSLRSLRRCKCPRECGLRRTPAREA